MKHNSVFARLISSVKNIWAGLNPRTAVMAVIIASAALAFMATPAMAQTITVTCNGARITGTQEQITRSMIALGCAEEVPDGTFVKNSGSIVRSGPGTAYAVIGSKIRNTQVSVDATSADEYWCRLEGELGWMACWLLIGVKSGLPVDDSLIVANAASPAAAPAATTAPAPAAAPAAAASATSAFTFCGQTFPTGSVMYEDATVWRGGNPEKDQLYNVVFDPSQAGRGGKTVKGWWYQPCLPGSNREAHEVAIILQAGSYDYVGPECRAWVNFDNAHPFDGGNLIVDRRNGVVDVPPTQGEGTRAFVFVKCNAGDASGFSFSRN